MNEIYDHFDCYTRLPVLIDDVRNFIVARGVVDRIEFSATAMDDGALRGMLNVHEELGAYGNRIVARIIYSRQISDDKWIRLVCCKELLHILDREEETASTVEEVSHLIDHITVPFEAGFPQPSMADHLGMIRALRILMPRDALHYLRIQLSEKNTTAEEISRIAEVPLSFVQLSLLDEWWDYVNLAPQQVASG
ncbi:MAG: hypothetical protein OXI95_15290 [bacterium]|nr:hypothetical protein [bacterium]